MRANLPLISLSTGMLVGGRAEKSCSGLLCEASWDNRCIVPISGLEGQFETTSCRPWFPPHPGKHCAAVTAPEWPGREMAAWGIWLVRGFRLAAPIGVWPSISVADLHLKRMELRVVGIQGGAGHPRIRQLSKKQVTIPVRWPVRA
jgi:hypothetical protein